MRIGIDLGGTKIEGIVMSDDGDIVRKTRVPSPADYASCLKRLTALVATLETECGHVGLPVGMGTPGTMSPQTGVMKNANSTHLNGRNFLGDISTALNRQVIIANDANCFTLSEATDGAGAGHDVVFGVILGTGVGGGIVINGRAIGGPHGITGEWGHTPLPWMGTHEHPGPKCWCGKHGCIETWLSGPGVTQWAEVPPNQLTHHPEQFDIYVDRLARALAQVINIIDPDIIVLGGGLSNIDALYAPVQARLGAYVFSDQCHTPVVRNVHGDSSGVRGAAWLTQ